MKKLAYAFLIVQVFFVVILSVITAIIKILISNQNCCLLLKSLKGFDVMEFVVSYLSVIFAVLAVLVSVYALFQTERHHRESQIAECANTARPFLVLDSIIARDNSNNILPVTFDTNNYVMSSENGLKFSIIFRNCSDSVLHNMVIYPLTGFGEMPIDCVPYQTIPSHDFFKHHISARSSGYQEYTIYYQNIIGFVYSQQFCVQFEGNMHCDESGETCVENRVVSISMLSHQKEHPELWFRDGKYCDKSKGKAIKDC